MKQMILSLVAGVCAASCSLAETNAAARNLGLKWDMLRSGVGVRKAQVGGGFMYQHIPEAAKKYPEGLNAETR